MTAAKAARQVIKFPAFHQILSKIRVKSVTEITATECRGIARLPVRSCNHLDIRLCSILIWSRRWVEMLIHCKTGKGQDT